MERTTGETIKMWRENAGYSKTDLTRLYKLPARTLVHWESNDRTPPEWAVALLVDRLMMDAQTNITNKMQALANRLKADENGERPEVAWVLITTRPTAEFKERAKDMYDAIKMHNEQGEGTVACILVNVGTLDFYEDRNGRIESNYESIDL